MINEAELKEMSREDALKLYIPKWPQCIINGNKITPEQADEIIRRTDCYIRWPISNDHEFDKEFKKLSKGFLDFNKTWKFINLYYLDNDFIASSFVDGANGWCHPDGTIAYCYNIGKWPEIEDVESDLQKITKEFPFLRLECTLCLYEYCASNNESIITMIAENGNVKFYEPVPYDKLEKVEKQYKIEEYHWVSHCFTIDHIKGWFDKIKIKLDESAEGEE